MGKIVGTSYLVLGCLLHKILSPNYRIKLPNHLANYLPNKPRN